MFCMLKKERIYHAYALKHKSKCENQLLINDSRPRMMALCCNKKLSAFPGAIALKNIVWFVFIYLGQKNLNCKKTM